MRSGDRDQFAAAPVLDPVLTLATLVENAFHSGRGLNEAVHRGETGGIVDVDVCHLMIGDSKRGTGARIEHVEPELVADLEQAVLPEHTIEMDRRSA
jgi:hypothetical protein